MPNADRQSQGDRERLSSAKHHRFTIIPFVR